MKLSKTTYLHVFTIIVLILGCIRFYGVLHTEDSDIHAADSVDDNKNNCVSVVEHPVQSCQEICKDTRIPHRIYSVPRYETAFPDGNDEQLTAANKYGIKAVENNEDAERRKSELVYVGASPWFAVDKLNSSCPYLVPRASILLQDIGKAFFDSLDVKGVPLHKIIATSVLRTKESVEKLRARNLNATENSCHLYGTTFDICYNRYITVESPDGPKRKSVTNDTLKWILSEVLSDFRKAERCYVKYEVKQGCFHITTR